MYANVDDAQSAFLDALVIERKVVWVFLVNGIKLTGQLTSFDKRVLLLQSPTGLQTVFKSAVSTVCPPHVIEGRQSRDGRPVEQHERFRLKRPQR
ncbi:MULTISPECIES: RNA chaperone Hfq [unclassified Caballeronia]|uniref:RNA chaperone Hfq n=1 Tax=unclassified Caballeronia TaxID=2646786 RepID=UPI00285BE292|nr:MULTISPECIES: RNA chaperone Hfq [unclassified Caballeronia]MDR5763142.1 RNA chaperone Hfq [Caballeronia sp. LZ035]MDR5883988.1 RNA chaperone Hfq [Caballeronia sp. LZ032]